MSIVKASCSTCAPKVDQCGTCGHEKSCIEGCKGIESIGAVCAVAQNWVDRMDMIGHVQEVHRNACGRVEQCLAIARKKSAAESAAQTAGAVQLSF